MNNDAMIERLKQSLSSEIGRNARNDQGHIKLEFGDAQFLIDMLDYAYAAGILEGRLNSKSIEENRVGHFLEEMELKYPEIVHDGAKS